MNLEYPDQCLLCLDTIGEDVVKREVGETPPPENFQELCILLAVQCPETPKAKRILAEKDGFDCGKLVCWRCQQMVVDLKRLQDNLRRIQRRIKHRIWDVQEAIRAGERKRDEEETFGSPTSSIIVDFKEFGDAFRKLVREVPSEEPVKVELTAEGSALQLGYEALENESDEVFFNLADTDSTEVPEPKHEAAEDSKRLLEKLDIEFEEVDNEADFGLSDVSQQSSTISSPIPTKTSTPQKSSPNQRKSSVSCRYCNTQWNTPEKYVDHRISSHPDDSQALAKSIANVETEKPGYFTICPICHDSKPKLSIQHFLEHVLSHELTSIPIMPSTSKDVLPPQNLKTFVCTHCSSSFRHKFNLDLHLIFYHESSLFTLKCSEPQCGATFKSRSSLIAHITTAHSPTHLYPCKSCPSVSTSADQILSHMRIHVPSKSLLCPLCRLVSPSLKFLYEHFSATHPSLLTPLKCSSCSETFLMPATFRKHIQTAHPAHIPAEIVPPTTTQPAAPLYPQNLTGPLPCPHCSEPNIFKNATTLENHIRIYHDSNASKHPCPHCPKEFVHRSTLRYHIQQVHLGIRYPCTFPSCDKSFTAKSLLKMHLKLHANGGGPAQIKCNLCTRSFGSQSALKTHKITQHGPKEPADCDICGKHFLNKYSLRAHKSEVHNLKPYTCSVCSLGCARLRMLEKHMLEQHGMELSHDYDMELDVDTHPFQVVSVETFDME